MGTNIIGNTMNKECKTCEWLVKCECNEQASYMNVCTVENPEELDDGMYMIVVVDLNEFDASDCLNYRPK